MRIKFYFLKLLLSPLFFSLLFIPAFVHSNSNEKLFSHDSYVHALASLTFYLNEHIKDLKNDSQKFGKIRFSEEKVANLWERIRAGLFDLNDPQSEDLFLEAYKNYEQALHEALEEKSEEAKASFKLTFQALDQLLYDALEKENEEDEQITDFNSPFPLNRFHIEDPNIEYNRFISMSTKKAISPYLLPLEHPMRKPVDSIFLKMRVTANAAIFFTAGFRTIATGPRSHIIVAKHCKLPDYLVKIFLDSEVKKKFNMSSWKWLVRRCEGAKKIRNIIRRRHIRLFAVPDKWIYPLSPSPAPPNDRHYTRHLAILLVTDMKLATEKANYQAWFNKISKEHLNELYEIIVRAKGSSYRPDNIALTRNGKFAFIDTEYPTSGPDFKSIRYFLNSELCDYWDSLVTNGGP